MCSSVSTEAPQNETVERNELTELHYIVPTLNLPSILGHGIVCHHAASSLHAASVASPEIQARRTGKRVPGGLLLHDYVNLYINARNKMMFEVVSRAADRHSTIAVLSVDTAVLDLPNVVISDRNAASGYVRFHPSPEGLAFLNREYIFARSWRHPEDRIEYYRHSSAVCAEVLVPDVVEWDHIRRVYTSCAATQGTVIRMGLGLPVVESPDLFFRMPE